MQRGYVRINATMEQIHQLSEKELEARLYSHMPEHVFRLMTFEENDYEDHALTILCFNFIPPCFFVTIPQNHDMETALQEVAKLNPGLVWEKAQVSHAKEKDEILNRKTQELTIISVPAREDVNNAGEKIRLSQLDIQSIYKTLSHPAFQMGAIGMFFNKNPLNPCFISNREMIFIYGNDHFGTIHINQRHGWFTDGSEWRTEESGRVFLDNPSKFARTSIPIDDYSRIADEIYKPANKVSSKDKEAFEKYTGVSNYAGEESMTFHLIVYKGTKIIHTMFPQSKKLNRIKKGVLDYKKGILKIEHNIFHDLLIATLPYYNAEFIIRYVIIIKLYNNTGGRQIWIETTTLNGNPMFCEKVQETFDNSPMDGEVFLKGLEYADFSGLEKWIRQFDSFLKRSQNEGQL